MVASWLIVTVCKLKLEVAILALRASPSDDRAGTMGLFRWLFRCEVLLFFDWLVFCSCGDVRSGFLFGRCVHLADDSFPEGLPIATFASDGGVLRGLRRRACPSRCASFHWVAAATSRAKRSSRCCLRRPGCKLKQAVHLQIKALNLISEVNQPV
jgi:hypothetical protein